MRPTPHPVPAGRVIKGQEVKARSRYEEDVLVNNHTAVWGSWWHEGTWGYACCHSAVKNSYCTGKVRGEGGRGPQGEAGGDSMAGFWHARARGRQLTVLPCSLGCRRLQVGTEAAVEAAEQLQRNLESKAAEDEARAREREAAAAAEGGKRLEGHKPKVGRRVGSLPGPAGGAGGGACGFGYEEGGAGGA